MSTPAALPVASTSKLTFQLDQPPSEQGSGSSTSKARTGQLSFGDSQEIATPSIVHYTKKGAPVHLSRDNVDRLPIEMVMMAYEHLLVLSFFTETLSSLLTWIDPSSALNTTRLNS